jgi:PAS domain S-box-containing protein
MNTADSVGIEAALAAARQRAQQQTTLPVLALASAAGGVTLAMLWQFMAPAVLAGWAFALVLALGLRAWAGQQSGRTLDNASSNGPSGTTALRLAFFLHGAVWGGLPWLLPANAQPAPWFTVAGVITLMASASLVSTAFDRLSAACFVFPSVLPLVGGLLALRAEPLWGTTAVVVGFIALMALVAHHAAAVQVQKIESALLARTRSAEMERHLVEADQARKALADEHLRMQQLVHSTLQGYWFIDAEGISREANPAMCALLGRPLEQVIGRPVMDFFQGPERVTLETELAQRRAGHSTGYEVDIVRPDGSRIHCHNNATPILDAAGQRIGSIGLWTDLTANRQREQELRTYERLANSLDDAVAVVGLDRRYRLVNDAWCRAVGMAREAALGHEVGAERFNKLPAERLAAIDSCFATGAVTTMQNVITRPDGATMLLQTTFTPFRESAHSLDVSSVILIARDITVQERDRVNALSSAEYLRATLNATGEAIFATDADDQCTPLRFINEPMLRMWGISPERADKLTAADIMATAMPMMSDPEGEARHIRKVVERGGGDESRVELRDGRVLWRRCESARVDGRHLRVWSFRDITNEERSLRVLHDGEAEQRALLDAFPGHIGRLDADLRFTFLNERLAALLEVPSEGLIGRQLVELSTKPLVEDLLLAAQAALHGDTVVMERAVSLARDAAQVQLTLSPGVEPILGRAVVYVFGLDITNLKRAEAATRSSEAELRAVLKAFPGHIVTVDQDFRYVHLDEGVAEVLGLPVKDIVGRHLRDVLGEERFQANATELVRAFKGERVVGERVHPARGHRPAVDLEVTHVAGPRRPDGRQLVYMFGLDITERKRAQAALAAARDDAQRANQAKSQFLSHMSHELRTPMNAIAGFAQLLQVDQRAPLAAHQHEYVKQIRRGADHLLSLINGLLDLNSIEAGKLVLQTTAVPVVSFMEDALNLVRPLAQDKGVTLMPISGIDLARQFHWAVHADRTRLRQVLLNLLGNAVKYSPAGASVTLGCSLHENTIEVAVRDTGPGLSSHEQARLFRPFERLGAERGPVEGTGIGLALSRQLTEAMGGTIGVHSAAGHGSTFWIRLPLEATPAAWHVPSSFAALETDLGRTSGPARVLYVDDNAVNLLILESMLERVPGLSVTTHLSARDGLAWALANQPDLILLDIHMPDMDGFALLASLKADSRTAHTPVVALSADAREADVRAALARGFCEYLTKPLDLELLLATVRRLLSEHPSQLGALEVPVTA